MSPRRIHAALTLLTAGAFAVAPSAYAEEVCQSVRVDLIQDWVYCVRASVGPDGSVTVGFQCDMGPTACENASVTVP